MLAVAWGEPTILEDQIKKEVAQSVEATSPSMRASAEREAAATAMRATKSLALEEALHRVVQYGEEYGAVVRLLMQYDAATRFVHLDGLFLGSSNRYKVCQEGRRGGSGGHPL